mgnify:CR=1 FL=1
MDLELKGKTALVSAASRGIGRAIAERLAREGANVYLCSRDGRAVEELAARLRDLYGVRAKGTAVDLGSAEEIERWVRSAGEEAGRIDALLCNTGGPPPGTILDLADAEWDLAYRTLLMSAVRLLRASHPYLKRAGGRVLAIASTSVKTPIPGLVLSNTFRAGVVALMKTLAAEWAKDGILLNTICPGRVQTERVDQLDIADAVTLGISAEEMRAARMRDIPLGRYGTTEELAEFAAFLLSPRNSYMTGSVYNFDGGMVRSL